MREGESDQVLTEYITAWRGWDIAVENTGTEVVYKLASGFGSVWPSREPLKALCRDSSYQVPHHVPSDPCMCGLYALKDISPEKGGSFGKIIGKVALWGRVMEASEGYRAEFAYPLTLEYVICSGCSKISILSEAVTSTGTGHLQIWCFSCLRRESSGQKRKKYHYYDYLPEKTQPAASIFESLARVYGIEFVKAEVPSLSYSVSYQVSYDVPDLAEIFGISPRKVRILLRKVLGRDRVERGKRYEISSSHSNLLEVLQYLQVFCEKDVDIESLIKQDPSP